MGERKPKRYAINIGLTKVNKGHYGDDLPFSAGPHVATNLHAFFKKLDFEDYPEGLLVNEDAKAENLIKQLTQFQDKLEAGDLLVLSFCGHTIRVKEDYANFLKNTKNKDRGWALWDRVMFHFELWKYAQDFKPGVKLIVISDSCNSGAMESRTQKLKTRMNEIFWSKFRDVYNPLLHHSGYPMHHSIASSVVIISSTARNETTQIIPEDTSKTYFSLGFQSAFKKLNPEANLSNFFDEINRELTKNSLSKDIKAPIQSAQWHYVQGHKHTKISEQFPPFL